MEKRRFLQELEKANHSACVRKKLACYILEDATIAHIATEIACTIEDPLHVKACWALEFACKEDIMWILPYYEKISKTLPQLKNESALRPMAKICEYIATFYFSNKKHPMQDLLPERQLERIITSTMDWLLQDHKVATHAYAMQTLSLACKKYPWITPELLFILEKNYPYKSAAYKARARMILKKLKKQKNTIF